MYVHVGQKNFNLLRKQFVQDIVAKDENRRSIRVYKMIPEVLFQFKHKYPIEELKSKTDDPIPDQW